MNKKEKKEILKLLLEVVDGTRLYEGDSLLPELRYSIEQKINSLSPSPKIQKVEIDPELDKALKQAIAEKLEYRAKRFILDRLEK